MALTVTASPCLFSKKNGLIMPLGQNPHQTVTRSGGVGLSMYACGFSVAQMPAKIKMSFIWKDDFFAKIGIFCKSIAGPLVQAYRQPYSFGGSIKLIICQIGHEVSVAIHAIYISWKKMLDGGSYRNVFILYQALIWNSCRYTY